MTSLYVLDFAVMLEGRQNSPEREPRSWRWLRNRHFYCKRRDTIESCKFNYARAICKICTSRRDGKQALKSTLTGLGVEEGNPPDPPAQPPQLKLPASLQATRITHAKTFERTVIHNAVIPPCPPCHVLVLRRPFSSSHCEPLDPTPLPVTVDFLVVSVSPYSPYRHSSLLTTFPAYTAWT